MVARHPQHLHPRGQDRSQPTCRSARRLLSTVPCCVTSWRNARSASWPTPGPSSTTQWTKPPCEPSEAIERAGPEGARGVTQPRGRSVVSGVDHLHPLWQICRQHSSDCPQARSTCLRLETGHADLPPHWFHGVSLETAVRTHRKRARLARTHGAPALAVQTAPGGIEATHPHGSRRSRFGRSRGGPPVGWIASPQRATTPTRQSTVSGITMDRY